MVNSDQISGEWKKFKGYAKEQWGKLTDDQLTRVEGSRDKLAGEIQKSYGVAREEAEEQVREWEKSCARRDAA